MNLFDVMIGVILVWGLYRGFKSGLIKSLGGILGWIASIIVALSFNQAFADYLDKRFDVVANFGEFIIRFIPLPNFSFEAYSISMTVVNAGIYEMALPDFLKRILSENISQLLASGDFFDASLPELIAYGLAGIFLNGISFLILFVVAGIMIKIGVDLLSKLVAATPLGPLNKLSGAALGVVMNMLVVTVIIGLISPVIILSDLQDGIIAATIYSSFSFLYLLELFTIIGEYIFQMR